VIYRISGPRVGFCAWPRWRASIRPLFHSQPGTYIQIGTKKTLRQQDEERRQRTRPDADRREPLPTRWSSFGWRSFCFFFVPAGAWRPQPRRPELTPVGAVFEDRDRAPASKHGSKRRWRFAVIGLLISAKTMPGGGVQLIGGRQPDHRQSRGAGLSASTLDQAQPTIGSTGSPERCALVGGADPVVARTSPPRCPSNASGDTPALSRAPRANRT